jgi:hypothetical protein
VGTTEDSSRQEPPAKRRRLSKEENAVGSADALRDVEVPVEPFKWESECVGKLATEVCRVKWKGRTKCQDLFTAHGRELLKRFRIEVKRYVFHDNKKFSLHVGHHVNGSQEPETARKVG